MKQLTQRVTGGAAGGAEHPEGGRKKEKEKALSGGVGQGATKTGGKGKGGP